MYCIKDPKELRKIAFNNLESSRNSIDFYLKEIDKLVKEFLRDKKRYDKWQTYSKIQNPKQNHEFYFNQVLVQEKSENSLYLNLMNEAQAQAENIGLGIQDFITNRFSDKEIIKIQKKVITKLSKMYK